MAITPLYRKQLLTVFLLTYFDQTPLTILIVWHFFDKILEQAAKKILSTQTGDTCHNIHNRYCPYLFEVHTSTIQ